MGILQQFGAGLLPMGGEPLEHRLQAAVWAPPGDEQATDQGFAAFGQHGGPTGPISGSHGPQVQQGFEAACQGQFSQPAIAHQLGPQGGALADAELGVVAAQVEGSGEAQHGVAEEFELFVINGPAGGTVAEGLFDGGEGASAAAGAGRRRRVQAEPAQQLQKQAATLGSHGGGAAGDGGQGGESRT